MTSNTLRFHSYVRERSAPPSPPPPLVPTPFHFLVSRILQKSSLLATVVISKLYKRMGTWHGQILSPLSALIEVTFRLVQLRGLVLAFLWLVCSAALRVDQSLMFKLLIKRHYQLQKSRESRGHMDSHLAPPQGWPFPAFSLPEKRLKIAGHGARASLSGFQLP